MVYQPPLPREYIQMDEQQMLDRIVKAKQQLGKDLVILGHHYQSDDVIQFADFIGDSLKLSQQAAATSAKYIIFCGVHFMAESADILSKGKAKVILPHALAGCAMSELAPEDEISQALAELSQMTGRRIIPITYVNSSAAAKAVTARAGGACCTSSNVRNVFEWAFQPAAQGGAGADKIFAIPDQHLGRNTAIAMGFKESDCLVYDPKADLGGLSAGQRPSEIHAAARSQCPQNLSRHKGDRASRMSARGCCTGRRIRQHRADRTGCCRGAAAFKMGHRHRVQPRQPPGKAPHGYVHPHA